MAPLSTGGKAFCVVYAALGLPASLALVATLRHCLLPLLSRPVAWVAVRWQLAPARSALLQAAALGLLVTGTFVLLPALVLWGLRGDGSLLEAIYFCFGSLSTIGLGDLLPGHGRDLNPVLYHLGEMALLGESSCQGAPVGEGRSLDYNSHKPLGRLSLIDGGNCSWKNPASRIVSGVRCQSGSLG